MPSESVVSLRTVDGLQLVGTLVVPDDVTNKGIVFVHGGGGTREEGGFFTRLALGLADAGVASLRYDLRGHGESEGLQQDSPLTAHELARLVLVNPLLDYKNRFVDQKPYWHNDHLDDEAARQLTEDGYLEHSPTFKLGRAMLNEVFWIHPRDVLGEIIAPTLILHGTQDTFVPIDSSRDAVPRFQAPHRLVEIEGAQHGIAVHDDPQYLHPQTQEWQAFAIRTTADWINGDPSAS